jgi:hypothetical protein
VALASSSFASELSSTIDVSFDRRRPLPDFMNHLPDDEPHLMAGYDATGVKLRSHGFIIEEEKWRL